MANTTIIGKDVGNAESIDWRTEMSCEEVFLKKLSGQGFRMTMQREVVLSVLHKLPRASSAEEIFSQVQHVSSAVDISTVYRTLELLQEFEMVISSDVGSGHRVYKLVSIEEPHIHLVCKVCGDVIGIETDPADKMAAYLEDNYQFQMDLQNFNIPGLCWKCQRKVRKKDD
jgi:Fur family transcriptional regulator, ferric uptake regulator